MVLFGFLVAETWLGCVEVARDKGLAEITF